MKGKAMRSILEKYLLACINDGWCAADGEVESPTGAFALVYVHEGMMDLMDFLDSQNLDDDDYDNSIPLGHLLGVTVDDQGFMDVKDFGFVAWGAAGAPGNSVTEAAEAWFGELETAYSKWLEAEED